MNLKTFIINMAESINRKMFMEAQLKNFPELDPEFINAINGKLIDQKQLPEIYDENKAKRIFGRELSLSEVGCALSHLSVYKRIISDDLPYALIFEDDVLISSYLSDILPDCINAFNNDVPQIVLLTPIYNYKKIKGIKLGTRYKSFDVLGPQHFLYPIWGVNYYAAAYIINKAACQKILTDQSPLHSPIDNWEYLNENKFVEIKAVIPYVISFTKEGRSYSTISSDRQFLNMDNRRKTKRSFFKLIKIAIIRRLNKVEKTDREIF